MFPDAAPEVGGKVSRAFKDVDVLPTFSARTLFATTSAVIDTQTTEVKPGWNLKRIQNVRELLPTKFWHYVRCQYNQLTALRARQQW
jgi:hypothetical protein